MGGLGNQMFQYAAAKSLAINRKTPLKIDLSFLLENHLAQEFTYRKYELNKFALNIEPIGKNELDKFLGKTKSSGLSHKLKNLINPYIIYEESNLDFDPSVLNLSSNTYLDGYFQSEKYFFNISDQIKIDFAFVGTLNGNNIKAIQKIKTSNSIAVHVRRSDYITNLSSSHFHGVCPLEYYENAINYLKQKLEFPLFFFFSDDMEWTRENFKNLDNKVFVDINNSEAGYDDLRLISHCKHQIIANSSFSWWGAWLNDNPRKIVIAPKKWFAAYQVKLSDRFPADWILI
jgi:hypothetical protein